MIDSELDRLLVQVRRIEEHREKGAEAEIRKTYQKLLQELRHYMADEYSRYAEDDKLTYDILQRNGYYARFLEEVEQKINDISPVVRRTIRSTVEQTYEHTYNGMIDCVQKAATGVDLGVLKGCTPEVIKRAVENPISKLTLNDRLEKHRKEIIYDIKQDISVGLMNGDRYSTMANRIKKSVEGDYKKAIRIARTETHRVREAGNHDAAVSVNDALKNSTAGVQMMKTWRTMKDERVRPAKEKGRNRKYDHRKMEGVSIPIDEEFTLPSGAKTMAPGQSGVAGEDINCRCYLSYGLQKLPESEIGDYVKNAITSLDDKVNEFDVSVQKLHNSDVKKLFVQSKQRTEIEKTPGKRSYYQNCKVYLSKNANASTIAHELFHEIDDRYGITINGMLDKVIAADYEKLKSSASGGNIKDMLYSKYPKVFTKDIFGIKVKKEYIGVSDIINGMTGGKIDMGYIHPAAYWTKGALQTETWAQYGRMLYEQNEDCLSLIKKIFPETTNEILRILREMIK